MIAARQIVLAFLFSSYLLIAATISTSVTTTCHTNQDCKAATAHYCETKIHRCLDCCEFVSKITCPPSCSWHYHECRNLRALSCKARTAGSPSSKAKHRK